MRRLRAWFLAPSWAVMSVLFLAPLAIVCVYSVLTRGVYGGVHPPFTAENYVRLIDPLYLAIYWRSFWIAALSTAFCLVLGMPLALFIAQTRKGKSLYLSLVILPFWTSFLVRTYALLFLLRDTGLINTALAQIGLIRSPLPLLYNDGAVVLGLVYSYLPFMVLPLYAAVERLDRSLLEAAADLGARPAVIFARVIVPLAMPGIRAGCLLVFIPCLGAFLTPDLLGGGKSVTVGTLIQNQFTTARDWPFGSAISLALMAAVAVLLLWGIRRSGEDLV